MKELKSPMFQWTLQMAVLMMLLCGCGFYAYQINHLSPYVSNEVTDSIPLQNFSAALESIDPKALPDPTPAAQEVHAEQPAATQPSLAETAAQETKPVPTALEMTYVELRRQYNNEDIVGHLKIEDTNIDYLVTQSTDNQYYLYKDIYKKDSAAGWVFLDYENDIGNDDKNTVIYAHNMRQNIMFHSLRNYLSEDYFKNHRYIIFETPYAKMTWEVFAFYRTDILFPYIQVDFSSAAEFSNLLASMKMKSIYDTGVAVSPSDRILTLSTCTNESDDTRFAVNAKLISAE